MLPLVSALVSALVLAPLVKPELNRRLYSYLFGGVAKEKLTNVYQVYVVRLFKKILSFYHAGKYRCFISTTYTFHII